eukprot:TRINITY_DN9778_c1_g2_i1.p1 TRINITY_DN9778_c1_g2~~TRINITY_DN9778_c1_g2_i1.p1  ORF type:complete len:183 (+),score=36.97 TRINITY_DN9778_c1_g2_i1:54-602(+)
MSTAGKKRKHTLTPEEEQHRGMIKHIARDVWCRIGPSKLHGVGVIALRDIPKNKVVDRVPVEMMPPFMRKEVDTESVHIDELQDVNEDVKNYLREMYVCTEGRFDISTFGVNTFVGLAHFVNHSSEPNVTFITSTEPDLGCNMKIQTIKAVNKGEELLCNYREYLTPEELTALPGMENVATE